MKRKKKSVFAPKFYFSQNINEINLFKLVAEASKFLSAL